MPNDSVHSVARMALDAQGISARKAFTNFTDHDARILKDLSKIVGGHAGAVVDGFYSNIEGYPELLGIIRSAGSDIERLKASQVRYLTELFGGVYDKAYFESRIRIGEVHCRIGLGPRWYLGSYSVYFALLEPVIRRRYRFRPWKSRRALVSLNRLLALDAQVAIETYIGALASEVSHMARQVSSAVNQQASGAQEQASAINQATATLNGVKVTSDQTTAKAESLNGTALRTREESTQGIENIAKTVAAMRTIQDKVLSIADFNAALNDQAKEIGEITVAVKTLAQKAKLLALNAAIEASNAGDAGTAFSVVATEIKALADQSEQSADRIQAILADNRKATDQAVFATEAGIREVEEGVSRADQAGQSITSLSRVIEEAAAASQQIVDAVRQESLAIDQISIAMREINTATEQAVRAADLIKGSVGELTTGVEKMREKESARP